MEESIEKKSINFNGEKIIELMEERLNYYNSIKKYGIKNTVTEIVKRMETKDCQSDIS